MWNFFFTCGQLKKWKKEVKSAPPRQICWVGWGRGYSGKKKKIYEDANQTENFIETKTRNDIYYRSEKHY